jgi:hypothetical protein
MGSVIRMIFGLIIQTIVGTIVADVVGSYLRHRREKAQQQQEGGQ